MSSFWKPAQFLGHLQRKFEVTKGTHILLEDKPRESVPGLKISSFRKCFKTNKKPHIHVAMPDESSDSELEEDLQSENLNRLC